jgi:hypothetical protein
MGKMMSASPSPVTHHPTPARRGMTIGRRKALEGYLYISPFLIGFLIFTAYPSSLRSISVSPTTR